MIIISSRPKNQESKIKRHLEKNGIKVSNFVFNMQTSSVCLLSNFEGATAYPSSSAINLPSDSQNLNSYLKIFQIFNKMKKFLKPETYKNFIIRNSIKNKNSFSINWKEINYNRIALINLLLKDFNNPSYLEIGCNKNKLFDSIYVEDKIGVDPIAGGNVRLTSDDFFKKMKKNLT